MVKAEFEEVLGKRVFVVGDRPRRIYATGVGQREIFRNGDIALHVTKRVGDWVGVRIYLIGGRRRKTWHFGVNVAERRESRVSDSFHLKAEQPAMVAWVVDYVCGDRRPAPPLGRGESSRSVTREEAMQVIDMIEAAAASGAPWSLAANTRKRGRYANDNICEALPHLHARAVSELTQMLATRDVIRSVMVDSHAKKYGLVVDRSKVAAALEKMDG